MKTIDNNNGNNFSFNFKKFKIFKNKLNKYFIEKYGETLNQKFKDKKTKEAIYKYLLNFDGKTDVFRSGRTENIDNLNLSEDILKIIIELKEVTKKILYLE